MTSTGDVGNIFTSMLGSPTQMLLGMTASVVFGFLINSFGVQKGLELVSKVMMVGLFILILALAVHSLCLPNAIEGVKFYLLPNLTISERKDWDPSSPPQ